MALPGLLIDIEEKAYDGQQIISALSIEIPGGEFVSLVGPSGCGKTTLLNLIAGLDSSYSGEVNFDDNHDPDIGYVFQNPRLMPWLTVIQNLELVCEERDVDMGKLLQQFGLDDCGNKYPSQISGGMRRRVAMARAFAIKPDFMMLDEPFLSLDLPSANRLRDLLINQWQEREVSVLFVTHNLHEALQLSDRIIFLSSQPMRAILDYRVTTPRPRSADDATIDKELHQLKEQYPNLLNGTLT